MTAYRSDEYLWAVGLAARLRLLQASCADDDPGNRQKYIADEIDRALKGVALGKKKAYLGALADRFPAWETPSRPPAALETRSEPAEETPETLLARLLEVAPQLPEAKRIEFSEQLRKAGLVRVDQADVVLEIPPDLQTKLAMAAGQTLNLERAVKLLTALNEWVLILDQLVWKIWKQLAPNSAVRREGGPVKDVKATAGRYLSGDPDVSIEQLIPLLDRSRRLIAVLMTAIVPAAERYAAQYFYRFSPEEIKQMAQMDKSWGGIEQKCWRKYLELFEAYPTPASIEKEIRDDIAKCAEELLMGPPGKSGN